MKEHLIWTLEMGLYKTTNPKIITFHKAQGATVVPVRLAKKAFRMHDILRELEWDDRDEDGRPRCPDCLCWEGKGHSDDCELNDLIN